jgi:Tfp pilus assembly protein FimV
MKKLFALMLALALSLSLVACGGGVDKQPVIDAFNNTTTGFDALAQKINANPDVVDAELAQDLADMSELLGEYKALLESDQELTQESADDMIA